jgi:hypothetical protein
MVVFTPIPDQHEWAILITSSTGLPLPGVVKIPKDIPGTHLTMFQTYELNPGDYLITAKRKNSRQYWGFEYTLRTLPYSKNKCIKVYFGIQHKNIIKATGQHRDLLPGSGSLAAIVREIHAIRRGIIQLDLGEAPIYPTRFEREEVI